MKRSGAYLAVRALENVGVRFTFGIPGVHNTELYDELGKSEQITPILVTHEQAASFMADGISRTSGSIGCIATVPAAGTTHAMSGIGEAFLDGIPMLILSGGIRRNSPHHFQLHELDQTKLVAAVTKAAFVVTEHDQVVPTIYKAYEIATSGEPGPVFIELSGDVQMFSAEVDEVPPFKATLRSKAPDPALVNEAARLLSQSKHPGLYLGWGAADATQEMVAIAERLGMPVATTMQGLSVFPADHPLHAGFGFGPSAVPAARHAFQDCDALLAVGCRFGELATGSFGMPIPKQLVHVDINPNVFNKNYPAVVAIESDAKLFGQALLGSLSGAQPRDSRAISTRLATDKREFKASWTAKPSSEKVSPGIFFAALREQLARDAYVVLDDGNHTFLCAEQFPVYESRHLISPTDFNCMGYCVPATIAVKLAHPDKQVVAVVGDGAFLMTGLEILTAALYQVGAVFFVFHDGELGQISQFQYTPLKYKTCTVLGDIRFEGIATAAGAAYLPMQNDASVPAVIKEALSVAAQGAPVIVDVKIDYSRKSEFTQGVVKVNLARFPFDQKLRFIGRALKRHTVG